MHLTCPICCELFGASDESGLTECGHLFHLACAVPWLLDKENCPQCRQNCTPNLRRVYFTGTSDEDVHLNKNCNIANTNQISSSNSSFSDNLVSSFDGFHSYECIESSDEINCLRSDLEISEEKISELKTTIESLEDALSKVSIERDELLKQIETNQCSPENINILLDENKNLRAVIKCLQEEQN